MKFHRAECHLTSGRDHPSSFLKGSSTCSACLSWSTCSGGQAIIEFLIALILMIGLISGAASLLHRAWQKEKCAIEAYEKLRRALNQGEAGLAVEPSRRIHHSRKLFGILRTQTRISGHQTKISDHNTLIFDQGASLRIEHRCGKVTESLALRKLDSVH